MRINKDEKEGDDFNDEIRAKTAKVSSVLTSSTSKGFIFG